MPRAVIVPLVAGSLVLAARVRPASRRAAARRRGAALGSPGAAPRRRRALRSGAASLADVVDLFAVAVAGGLNVRLAVEAVAPRAPAGPWRDGLANALREVAAGARLGEALERLPDRVGESARPLVAALLDAERYGTALGPTLERVASEARRARRREAEEAARRVPVRLLLPLVACILPAFGLLTVAPLIAGGLRALRLSP